jgi:hypothetical protein
MHSRLHRTLWFLTCCAVSWAPLTVLQAADAPADWRAQTFIRDSKSHVVPAMWEKLPKLDPKSTVTILDVDGPGVVSLIHASALNSGKELYGPEAQGVIVRVFYDGQPTPSINMPFMDFLGDIQCHSAYFSTVYFSKVKESHNFRLPMPFRKHIKIQLENPSDKHLRGYVDVQWEEVGSLPQDCGYLGADYRHGEINAQKPMLLFEANQPGRIAAHWLQYESEKSKGGETICEANQEIYLDGDSVPTLNYMGTEDVYGFSWGYKAIQSDGRMAILRRDDLQPAGSRIAVLRCRTEDAVSFRQSCRWILTFVHDPHYQKQLGDTPIPYHHCVYHYSKP